MKLNNYAFIVLLVMLSQMHCKLEVNVSTKLNLIEDVSHIICKSNIKLLFVYFENETSLGYSGQILHEMTNCGVPYICLRNKYKRAPLEVIRDDGILMYLVMIINDVTQPVKLSIIKKKSAAKHLSHVFLLIKDAQTVTHHWMRATFKLFWQLWLLNIVIMYWRDDHLHAYRYNPFTDDYLIKIQQNGTQLPTLRELFPKTIPNMQRKPLRMCIYPDEVRAIFIGKGFIFGTDGLLSNYIAQQLNATRIVDRANPFSSYNLSADICFMEVVNEFDDVAMNLRFLSLDTFHRRAEVTIAHNRDDLCVIVPKAQTASTFWNLFRSFRLFVWIWLVVSIVLANIFCTLVYRGHDFVERITLQLFACTLSMPLLPKVPKRTSLRLFLVFFLYFGMLICTAFRGNLTSMLVSHKSLPDINSIRDLAMSPYKILIRQRHAKHIERFMDTQHPNEAAIKEKMFVVTEEELLANFNANNLQYAYLEKWHIAAFQTNARHHMQQGRPYFHLMEDCLVPFHAVYIVPFGSPYLGFLNTLIRTAHEYGFETYWDHIMNRAFLKSGTTQIVRGHKKRGYSDDDDPIQLRLEHFHAVFFLWCLGMFGAALVFLYETQQRRLCFWFKKFK